MQKVKKYQHGFVLDPYVLSPDDTVEKVLECKREKGFTGIPITDTGKMQGTLLIQHPNTTMKIGYCEFVILLDNDQVSQRQICHNIQTFYTNICIDNRHNLLLLYYNLM